MLSRLSHYLKNLLLLFGFSAALTGCPDCQPGHICSSTNGDTKVVVVPPIRFNPSYPQKVVTIKRYQSCKELNDDVRTRLTKFHDQHKGYNYYYGYSNN